jgi:hypothetical protein
MLVVSSFSILTEIQRSCCLDGCEVDSSPAILPFRPPLLPVFLPLALLSSIIFLLSFYFSPHFLFFFFFVFNCLPFYPTSLYLSLMPRHPPLFYASPCTSRSSFLFFHEYIL